MLVYHSVTSRFVGKKVTFKTICSFKLMVLKMDDDFIIPWDRIESVTKNHTKQTNPSCLWFFFIEKHEKGRLINQNQQKKTGVIVRTPKHLCVIQVHSPETIGSGPIASLILRETPELNKALPGFHRCLASPTLSEILQHHINDRLTREDLTIRRWRQSMATVNLHPWLDVPLEGRIKGY